MPPLGGGDHIPIQIRDASGRKLRVFNPTIRVGEPPAGTDFAMQEWRLLRAELRTGRARRRWFSSLLFAALCFGPFIFTLIQTGARWYVAVLIGTFPLWAMLLLWGGVHLLLSRTSGVTAFVNIHEADIVKAMLKRNRCPSCAYRLPYATPDRRATCSECGAVWRSRNARPGPVPAGRKSENTCEPPS